MSLTGIFNSHLIMAACVQRHGTEEQKRRFLPKFASGELRGGLGADRARLRHRPAGDPHRARARDGDHYVVNGTKTWITNGIHGSCFALLVKTDPDAEPRHKGMSMFVCREGRRASRVVAQAREARLQGHRHRPSWCSRTTACRPTT